MVKQCIKATALGLGGGGKVQSGLHVHHVQIKSFILDQ